MSDWRSSTWGEEITLEYGKAIRGYQTANGPVPVYGTNGAVGWTDEPLFPAEGVILGRKGAYRGVHFSPSPFHVIDTAYYVVPKSDLDMRWLYYAIKYHRLGEIDDGSPIPSTTRAAVYVREFDVPTKAEQIRMAAVLAAFDDKIELNRRMNETLETQARALFRDWFVDFGPVKAKMAGAAPYLAPDLWSLFPDRLDDDGVPEGWSRSTVGECFNLTMGQSPPGDSYNDEGRGMPFFQGRTDFGPRFPSNRKFCDAPTRLAEPGDTLVSVRAPVGDLNVAWEACCIGRGVAALRHKSGSSSFTHYSAQSLQGELELFEHTGTVFGAINKKQFEALETVEPDPSLIEAYVAVAGPLDALIRNNVDEERTLAQTRDLLLPKLMSGEIRVGDVEHESASA